MSQEYVTKVKSNQKGRVYVTGFGINVLIPVQHLEEYKQKGFVEGYTKPYLNQLKETHDND